MRPSVRQEEQMMPFIPIVRVKSVEEGIAKSLARSRARLQAHGIIHSHDLEENMTAMARALDTTLFVKNGPCMAGLGLGWRRLSELLASPRRRAKA
jgi:aldehyde dehydrogenase